MADEISGRGFLPRAADIHEATYTFVITRGGTGLRIKAGNGQVVALISMDGVSWHIVEPVKGVVVDEEILTILRALSFQFGVLYGSFT